MNVLVTGGYGFIGSAVGRRFFEEGATVYIIDNLSTGHLRNVDFEHKSYLLNVEDEVCEHLFKEINFDVVVHCAANERATIYPGASKGYFDKYSWA